MKTLILFYSYTGNGKKFAEELSKKTGADIEEIKTEKRPGTIAAYVAGSLSARRHKSAKIQTIQSEPANYDKFILVAPIWAGFPAPAFNSVITLLPKDKTVEVYMISASGKSEKEKQLSFMKSKGFAVTDYHDIKQNDLHL